MTIRTTGCLVSFISLTTAGMAPLSWRPNRLSASSNMMSFLPPSEVLRYSPLAVKVLNIAPLRAMSSIASPVRWSEAFISTVPHPMSDARARAAEVFPMPGDPIRTTALFSGTPSLQDSAQVFSSPTAPGFPRTSFSVRGRYFSAQSSDVSFPPVGQDSHFRALPEEYEEGDQHHHGHQVPGCHVYVPVHRGHGEVHYPPGPFLQRQVAEPVYP